MASDIKKFYKFGDFSFDIQNLHLEHAGEAVRLPPKSLKALLILLEKRGETVTRESLIEDIWSESFVEDANLTVAVSTLRKTLSTYEREEKFIETVPCRGYRFVGEAEEKIETVNQPIVVERHTVEQLTIEKTSETAKKIPTARFLLFALLGLITAIGAFIVWQRGEKTSAVNSSSNAAASEAFLKGDALLQKRQVCESIPYFRQAISNDENFARAYSSLAAALVMCEFTDETDGVIAKALALDPNLPEAHATDGFIKMFRHLDWDGAESALRRAVALDPNSAKAHHWLGVCLSIRGHFREAEGELMRAIEIEPDSPLYHADLCEIRYFQPYPDRAIGECQKALELDPNFIFAPRNLRDIYLILGDEQKAWEYETKDLLNERMPPESIKADEEIFRRGGFKALYEGRVRYLLEQINNGNVNAKNRVNYSLYLARHYAHLGDGENTLYWVEQAVNSEKGTYPFAMAYIGVEPRYAFLRDEARFQAILEKMNLAR
jgi:DNA-binding winged helix-turn-helix (wHTH) protein/Tfp pilus assembly protein PilF